MTSVEALTRCVAAHSPRCRRCHPFRSPAAMAWTDVAREHSASHTSSVLGDSMTIKLRQQGGGATSRRVRLKSAAAASASARKETPPWPSPAAARRRRHSPASRQRRSPRQSPGRAPYAASGSACRAPSDERACPVIVRECWTSTHDASVENEIRVELVEAHDLYIVVAPNRGMTGHEVAIRVEETVF